MIADYLKFPVYFFVALLGCYFLGNLLVSFAGFRPEEKYARLFSKLLTGLVAGVLLISCLRTGFQTVNLGFLIVGLAFYYQIRQSKRLGKLYPVFLYDLKQEWLFLLQASLAGILVMAVRYWWSYGLYEYPLVNIDHVFYAKVSGYLLKTGIETSRLEYIFPESVRVQPYHFFELWLNAGLLWFFGGSGVTLLVLVTYPLGLAIVWLGFCAIAARNFKVTFGIGVLCLLGLFLMGVNSPYYSLLFINSYHINVSSFDCAKLFPVYLFFIAVFLLSASNRLKAAVTLLLGLPLLSIISAPAIFLSTGFYILFLILKRKAREAFQLALPAVAVACFLAWFYNRIATSNATPYQRFLSSNSSGLLSFQNLLAGLKLFLNIFVMVCFLYFLHWLLILLFGKLRILRALFSNPFVPAAFLIAFSALVCWVFWGNMLNASQFFSNVAIPLANLLAFIGLLISLQFTQYRKSLVCCFMFIFLMNFVVNVARLYYNPELSTKYFETVLEKTKKLNPIGGYIKNASDYGSVYLKASNVYPAGTIMNVSPEHFNFHAVNLSVFDIPIDTAASQRALEQQLVENTSFFQFVKQQKQAGTFRSIPQSQLEFVKQFNIQYLLVSKAGKIPPTLVSEFEEPVVDPVSGEKFYLLKMQ